ncbi:Lysophospholipase 1 [Frankliniella fusca]|uniref:Lysophospholipase 1 n=1 Tax=Frankliniella fusca TaxID=407009 RepID=A0AAE1GNY8_9NEOP|nr:Lysophospholipase 1 [Frankliniella fusca]
MHLLGQCIATSSRQQQVLSWCCARAPISCNSCRVVVSVSSGIMSQRQQSYYALVRWLSGQCAGTLTHNVSVSWILNFDKDDFDPWESFTVEWRKPPMPRGGQWPLYDCLVLEVSDDVDFLSRKLSQLRSQQEQTTPESRRLDSGTGTPLNSLDSNALRDTILRTLRSINVDGSSGSGSNRILSDISSTDSSCANQIVKKVGVALLLSNTAYIEAKAASSPSTMTMNLVRSTFSKRRLRRSSYAGQKRGGQAAKPSLKRYRKMQDIQDFVKSRFPYFSQSAFGAAVNNCVGKNVDKAKVVQLCDESDSDQENM